MRKAFLLLGSAALVAGSAASTAQSQGRGLNPRYVQEAQQDHPKMVEEFGGAETGQRATYVDSVGRRVAAYSGVSPQAYRFTVLNSAVENAFAVPGGYVYITRQLMGLMNDEAELASVLGHEAGHIAARHSSERQRTGILSQLGAILGIALSGYAVVSAVFLVSENRAPQATLAWMLVFAFLPKDAGAEMANRLPAANRAFALAKTILDEPAPKPDTD